ncbi:MAG: hypothetical protein ABI333_30670 [bacterium]
MMRQLPYFVLFLVVLVPLSACTSDPASPCETECDGLCVDTSSDPLNCGGCGIMCNGGTECIAGSCTCPTGLVRCGTLCVDTQTSNEHCGGCDNACSGLRSCDVGQCECPDGQEFCYGVADISFSTDFIYSRALLDQGGSYLWDHFDEGVQTTAAISGTFGSNGHVPPLGAADTYVNAARYFNGPGDYRINVQQMSFTDTSHNTVLYPEARFSFYTDDLSVGDLPIAVPSPNQPSGVVIYLVTVSPNDTCVHAVACGGFLQITEVQDATAADGGNLAFEATGVPLYYPTETPEGDLTASMAGSGLSICPRN